MVVSYGPFSKSTCHPRHGCVIRVAFNMRLCYQIIHGTHFKHSSYIWNDVWRYDALVVAHFYDLGAR